MTINASIGYNSSELSQNDVLFEGSDSEIFIIKGANLPMTPDLKASLNVDYAFNGQLFGAEPSLHFAYRYNGESVNSLAGIASTEVLNPVRVQEAYSIANLRFGLASDGWSAALFVNNLTNEYAKQFYNDRWIQTRLSVNQPRTYGITFRKNFQ